MLVSLAIAMTAQEFIIVSDGYENSTDNAPSTTIDFDFTDEFGNETSTSFDTDNLTTEATAPPSTTVLKPPETPPVTGTRYVTGITMTIIIVVAVFGNVVVLIAMYKTPSLQRVNTMMYASLAASDLCRTVICMPFYTYALYSNKWNVPDAACPMYHLFYITMRFICVLNLTVIAIERAFIIN